MQRVYCFLYATHTHTHTHTYIYIYIYIPLQIRLDHFVLISILFVQQPKTGKKHIGNVASAQNVCARNNHSTNFTHISSIKYVFLFSQLLGVSFYISMRNEKFE